MARISISTLTSVLCAMSFLFSALQHWDQHYQLMGVIWGAAFMITAAIERAAIEIISDRRSVERQLRESV